MKNEYIITKNLMKSFAKEYWEECKAFLESKMK